MDHSRLPQPAAATLDRLWDQLSSLGLNQDTGGYRRYAYTDADAQLKEWFADQARARGLDLHRDRAGNLWAWWGDPDAAVAAGRPAVVTGSHLDSVPDGGAYDGPLGVVSAFAALDALRASGFTPSRPIGVVNFTDEEGARFGVACAGSRLLTGVLTPERALALTDADGLSMAEAMRSHGYDPGQVGSDQTALSRVGAFVELHIEQGRGLALPAADPARPVAVGSAIWPHGRWRFDLAGQANHAGTTRLPDRRDPLIGYAELVLAARQMAERHDVLATCGKVSVHPNGVNAIASSVTGWLDARGSDPGAVRDLVSEFGAQVLERDGSLTQESWTDQTGFDTGLVAKLSRLLGDVPVLATGAGHDAGILANAGIPVAMLFVRNPTGISHSPEEYAERDDCLAGVAALAAVLSDLAG